MTGYKAREFEEQMTQQRPPNSRVRKLVTICKLNNEMTLLHFVHCFVFAR